MKGGNELNFRKQLKLKRKKPFRCLLHFVHKVKGILPCHPAQEESSNMGNFSPRSQMLYCHFGPLIVRKQGIPWHFPRRFHYKWSCDSIENRGLTFRPVACERLLCDLAWPLVSSFISVDFTKVAGILRKPGSAEAACSWAERRRRFWGDVGRVVCAVLARRQYSSIISTSNGFCVIGFKYGLSPICKAFGAHFISFDFFLF